MNRPNEAWPILATQVHGTVAVPANALFHEQGVEKRHEDGQMQGDWCVVAAVAYQENCEAANRTTPQMALRSRFSATCSTTHSAD